MTHTAEFIHSTLKIVTLHAFPLSLLMAVGMILLGRKNAGNQLFSGLFLAYREHRETYTILIAPVCIVHDKTQSFRSGTLSMR
jgi:hypothetical protein